MPVFIDIANSTPGNAAAALILLFALLIGHAVGDYALQSDFLARAKNHNANLSQYFPEGTPQGLWFNVLMAHSLIHAGAVWLITGSAVFALIECFLHAVIDFCKSEEWISFRTDQALHRMCKVVYVAILYMGVGWVTWSPI